MTQKCSLPITTILHSSYRTPGTLQIIVLRLLTTLGRYYYHSHLHLRKLRHGEVNNLLMSQEVEEPGFKSRHAGLEPWFLSVHSRHHLRLPGLITHCLFHMPTRMKAPQTQPSLNFWFPLPDTSLSLSTAPPPN